MSFDPGSIVKQELEDKLDFVQPASFVYSGELVEELQASSSLGVETNNKSCDFPGSPVIFACTRRVV
jgi:hypothetical protein